MHPLVVGDWTHFGWEKGDVRRGRPGLAGHAPPDLSPGVFPAASSLSRIFVRIGNGLNGPVRLELRFLLNYVVAKHESYFSHGSGLVCIHAIGAEDVARRVVDRMNPRKVSANEETSVLKSGRHSD